MNRQISALAKDENPHGLKQNIDIEFAVQSRHIAIIHREIGTQYNRRKKAQSGQDIDTDFLPGGKGSVVQIISQHEINRIARAKAVIHAADRLKHTVRQEDHLRIGNVRQTQGVKVLSRRHQKHQHQRNFQEILCIPSILQHLIQKRGEDVQANGHRNIPHVVMPFDHLSHDAYSLHIPIFQFFQSGIDQRPEQKGRHHAENVFSIDLFDIAAPFLPQKQGTGDHDTHRNRPSSHGIP